MQLGFGLGLRPRRGGASVALDSLTAEGDSITYGDGTQSYNRNWAAANPSITYANVSAGGAVLGTVADTLPTNSAYARRAGTLATNAKILSLALGANDLTSYASAQAYHDALQTFTAPFRSAGWKIVICGVLERNSQLPTINTFRHALHTLFKASLGVWIDAFADFDDMPIGADGASSDITLFSDGTHPTYSTGHGQMQVKFTTAMNYVRGIANNPYGMAFTPVAGATLSTSYDSNTYTVVGLHHNESRPYSVSGGLVSKNGGAFSSSSGTVVAGDTLRVRGTSSGSNSTQTTVALTVGATTSNFVVETAGVSGTWTPAQLSTKLKLWLRPEDIAGANASQMTTWPDNSGNSVTVTGAGFGSKPTVVASGLAGYKTVKFDPSYNQAKFTLPGTFLSGRTASSTFFVSKNVLDPPSANFAPPVADWGTDATGEFYPYTNTYVYSSYATNTRNMITAAHPAFTSWRVASFHSATNDWRYYVDGSNIATLATSTFAAGSAPQIGYSAGGGTGFEGQIAEIIDCNDVLTTLERQKVEGYLAWKYGLQANLPVGHPYLSAAP